ncbi:hypothetical protein D3C85_748240 [compost metagenome]
MVHGFVDVVALRKALGLGDAPKGAGGIAKQRIQLGQAQVAPECCGVAAGQTFLLTGVKRAARLLITALLHQQGGPAQLHATTHRTGLVAPGIAQLAVQALEQGFRAQQLTADFQQLHMAEQHHAFQGQAGLLAGLLDGCAIEFLGLVEVPFTHRLFDLQRAAEQALAPGAFRQLGDRLGQQNTRLLGGAAMERQIGLQRFPLRDQPPLAAGCRLRGETRELVAVVLGFVQAAAEQQRPGIQQHQARAAAQQLLRQFATPLHQLREAAPLQQRILAVALHQAGGDLQLPGLDCVLQGQAHLVLADVPLAGLAKHRLDQDRGQLAGQRSRHQRLDPEDLPLRPRRLDKQPAVAELFEPLHALADAQQLLAQGRVEMRQQGQGLQRLAPVLR